MPSWSQTPVCSALLLLILVAGGYGLMFDHRLVANWAFRPAELPRGAWRGLTAHFMHASPLHLMFNILAFASFGPPLERILGSADFAAMYAGAELAGLAAVWWRHREEPAYASIGASAAITGVVFGFCLFHPWSRVSVFLLPVGIPAFIFAAAFTAWSVYAARRPGSSGIAHDAHLGGAAAGVLLTVALEPRAVSIFLSQIGL